MPTSPLPRVLFVDDESNLLDSMRRKLHGRFEVHTALGAEAGLEIAASNGPFAVIVSDMRMPGMSGAQFLTRVAEIAPDTPRILLTGQADLMSTIAAVNEGQIFRFLCKPCAPDELTSVLDAAVEHYDFANAERELLERTLRGSVDALLGTLALVQPALFGRTLRTSRLAGRLAHALDLPVWELEVAASLVTLGAVTLPATVLEKTARGAALLPAEKAMIERAAEATDHILERIPRLERVRAIVRGPAGAPPDVVDSARVLALASAYESLVYAGMRCGDALDRLAADGAWESTLLHALRKIEVGDGARRAVREVAVSELHEGLVLADDLRLHSGVLLVARGQDVSERLLLHLAHWRPQLPERIAVMVASPRTPERASARPSRNCPPSRRVEKSPASRSSPP